MVVAVWRRKAAMANALLNAGADAAVVDAEGLTPLQLASILADVPMIRRLLAIDARTRYDHMPVYIGMCDRRSPPSAFSWGAVPAPHSVSSCIEGPSLLLTAVERSHIETIVIVIEAREDQPVVRDVRCGCAKRSLFALFTTPALPSPRAVVTPRHSTPSKSDTRRRWGRC